VTTTSPAKWATTAAVAGIVLWLSSALAGDGGRPIAPFVRVSADGRALEVKRSSEAKVVRVDVLDRCGDPVPGPPKIREIKVDDDKIVAFYGKHCWATIPLRTLLVECSGCD
jgi:hypothetical protein